MLIMPVVTLHLTKANTIFEGYFYVCVGNGLLITRRVMIQNKFVSLERQFVHVDWR